MPTCPAAAEQNDGDKRRENGPGKVTTVSVGQGEAPANLLTVVHKRCKRFFRHVAAASRKFFVLVLVLHPRVPVLIRERGPRRGRFGCGCATLCNLWTLWSPNLKIRWLELSKKLNRKVFSKPSVSSRVRRMRTLRSPAASACSTCVRTIILD